MNPRRRHFSKNAGLGVAGLGLRTTVAARGFSIQAAKRSDRVLPTQQGPVTELWLPCMYSDPPLGPARRHSLIPLFSNGLEQEHGCAQS